MPVMVFLCGFLLYPVAAVPAGSQPKSLPHPSSSLESQLPIVTPLSCRNLTPESLPNFNRLDPLPRYLISLALYMALEKGGCPTEAHALRQKLYRLGGVNATETLIQQLQGLQGNRAEGKADGVLFSILRFLSRRERSGRAPRSLSPADCVYEKEQQVHRVMQLLPQVGSYYNIGTAFYYAAQNCTAQAWQRGQEGVLDLGYGFLVGLMGIAGGPVGMVAGFALKPVVMSGVQRLIEYYYSDQEGSESPLPGTDPSWQDWRTTTEMGSSWHTDPGVTPTASWSNYRTDEVTEATSFWNWGYFKIWGQ